MFSSLFCAFDSRVIHELQPTLTPLNTFEFHTKQGGWDADWSGIRADPPTSYQSEV